VRERFLGDLKSVQRMLAKLIANLPWLSTHSCGLPASLNTWSYQVQRTAVPYPFNSVTTAHTSIGTMISWCPVIS
jgi:hypothetical protein